MGAKIAKRHASYKSQPKDFKLFLIFLPDGPSQNYLIWDFWNFENWDFLRFENWNFNDFFFVSLNMGPYGSENFKMLLLLQIAVESF